MQKIIFSLGLCCIFLGFAPKAICNTTPFDSIKFFIENGDIERINSRLDRVVLVDILGKDNYYSQTQAAMLIGIFFKTHPIEKFTILSTGGNHTSSFGIGRMRSKDVTYRITCSVAGERTHFSIHRIKIEIDD